MPVDVVTLLRELDLAINEGRTSRSLLLRTPGGETLDVVPSTPVERLTAHSVRGHLTHPGLGITALMVGQTATEGVVEQARAGKINILTQNPLQLIHGGTTYTVDEAPPPIQPRRATRPAWTRWAVERYLLLANEPSKQPVIAEILGTTQQSVSNAALTLGPLVTDHGNGLVATHKRALLAHWLNDYTGPGGQEFGWYSLDTAAEQTTKAVALANLLNIAPLISGDVAADRIAPWKLPSRGRVYVSGPIDLTGEGFVPAPVDEATLITCVPRDTTLWRLSDNGPATADSTHLVLADAAIVYWDVLAGGDPDSADAADHLADHITGGSA